MSTRVKRFTNISSDRVVDDVNTWLDKNPGVKVISSNVVFEGSFYYFVIYEGHEVYE